jgi:hypothetical protein
MAEKGQPTVERPIEQAPEWLRDLMTPTGELAALREEALRYLAGDRTARVKPLENVDTLFDDAGGRGAA